MRGLSPSARRRDPAPSRAAYRLTRLWLSPRVRWLVLGVLPVCATLAAAGNWLAQPAQRDRLAGWAGEIRASIEARPEFRVHQLAITGAAPELADAIRARLALDFPLSWFDIDAAAIHDRVAALDAVRAVEVSVELRGALRLDVTERVPAVLWRRPGGVELLDAGGHRIGFIDRRDGRPELPLVTGAGADRAVPEALALIAAAEPLIPRLRALTRVGERRWDVMLDRGQVIRLPERGARAALERVLAMDDAMELLTRDVPVVDMRLPRRPTIRLGPEAEAYLQLARSFEAGTEAER